MAVESHFERLEQEVGRLVEILDALRHENVELKTRIEDLETENARLKRVEEQLQEANESREAIRERIEGLLAKLDAVEL